MMPSKESESKRSIQRAFDFSVDEYAARLGKLREYMAAANLDVVLVDQFEHLVYFFGYLPTAALYQGCLVRLEGPPHMIVRALDLPTFRSQSWVDSYTAFADHEDPIGLVAQAIGSGSGHIVVGVEMRSNFLTLARFSQLRALLPMAQFVDVSSFVWELRLTKSEAELDYLRQAAMIADQSMLAAIAAVTNGGSVREPAAAVYSTAIRMGADNGRVALFGYGRSASQFHGRLGTDSLSRGAILHLEMVPQVCGYSARIMRPVIIGTASPEQLDSARRLITIQDDQISAMIPGAIAGEVDAIAREQVLATGLRSEYPNATGYTLGYHATPRTSDFTRAFMPTATWFLEPGMVFHMYLVGKGMAFSETIHITTEGPERLSRLGRELIVAAC